MPTQNGTSVNFSFKSTSSDGGLTATGFTSMLLQSVSYESSSQKETVRGVGGDRASENYYDEIQKATLTFVIAGASKAAAITATVLTTTGTFVSITSCASHPALIAANWTVQDGSGVTGDVTKSAEMKMVLEKAAGITAAQS